MNTRKINIIENGKPDSKQIKKQLKQKLSSNGFTVEDTYQEDAELTVCIGGDGSLLTYLEEYDFPQIPIVGINTGHLGFFQELNKKEIDEFLFKYKNDDYSVQSYKTVSAKVLIEDDDSDKGNGKTEEIEIRALNEITVKGAHSHAAHLNIFIGDSFIEKFSGDGIVVSTPAGSTAYNYALGGSIVDPRLALLQVTPIAPINSTAYRSFTSSILLPPDLHLGIFPEYIKSEDILLMVDGVEKNYNKVKEIKIGFHPEVVKMLRFKDYDFWKTVKMKLL